MGTLSVVSAVVRPAPSRELECIRRQMARTKDRLDKPQGTPTHLHVRAMKWELEAYAAGLEHLRDRTLKRLPVDLRSGVGFGLSCRADEMLNMFEEEILSVRIDRYQPGAITQLKSALKCLERAYGRINSMDRMVRR